MALLMSEVECARKRDQEFFAGSDAHNEQSLETARVDANKPSPPTVTGPADSQEGEIVNVGGFNWRCKVKGRYRYLHQVSTPTLSQFNHVRDTTEKVNSTPYNPIH